MSKITSIPLPIPINWKTKKKAALRHLNKLETLFNQPSIKALYIDALAQVSAELKIKSRSKVASYWRPFLYGKKTIRSFFLNWLTYTPKPENPGEYIEYWDYLVNTESGLVLSNHDAFRPWFRTFLNFHGDWINSTSSTGTLAAWKKYPGTPDHPFDINDYKMPNPNSETGGYKSFNQFFLRNLKGNQRPLCTAVPEKDQIVAPCDGGVFFLSRGGDAADGHSTYYDLPGKSDQFNLMEALPGYGRLFVGGQLLDILLWFTDYHHFHAPVSGRIIDQGLYEGSFNYDFGDYDPKDHFAPKLPADSDRVGWYEKLGKHQRYVWIIKTKNFGLVAMIAIGFWGVGSIVNDVYEGAKIEKGQYMGHFGYGGSSIVLAFEPGVEFDFKVGEKPVRGPDFPVLMKVRECLGTLIK
ncbi:MAG: phosphatidylserine decarboxylase [Saprospiraceae bacterium]|nr:phosphatidylserine decarboxylase [Saprospiraceae bacterium]